ncbi:MAG: ORF6N domain-containing protein [Ginsengibacter sp.]
MRKVSEEIIIEKIYVIRGMKVMLDRDLAEMYGVPTFRSNEAVKRNIPRFPDDFMFQLSEVEFKSLISQFAISKVKGRGGIWLNMMRKLKQYLLI